MLDLNETEITNEGIRYLARLESLLELRLKECTGLDNNCIGFLNQLISLKLLYVRGTGITIEGLLNLTHLQNLEQLYFSTVSTENILEKMQKLTTILPGCKFIIDGKPYEFA